MQGSGAHAATEILTLCIFWFKLWHLTHVTHGPPVMQRRRDQFYLYCSTDSALLFPHIITRRVAALTLLCSHIAHIQREKSDVLYKKPIQSCCKHTQWANKSWFHTDTGKGEKLCARNLTICSSGHKPGLYLHILSPEIWVQLSVKIVSKNSPFLTTTIPINIKNYHGVGHSSWNYNCLRTEELFSSNV